ncbi:MAG TPA: hypothetical protein ENI23_10410 [bacterium]|nr:hypothetical protein [bacterium]
MNLKKPWPNVKYKYLIEEEMPHPLSQEKEQKNFIFERAKSEQTKFNYLLDTTIRKYVKWPCGYSFSPLLENEEELFQETIELVASLYANIDIHQNVSSPYVVCLPSFIILYCPLNSIYPLYLPYVYTLGQLSELKKNVSEMEDKLGEKK